MNRLLENISQNLIKNINNLQLLSDIGDNLDSDISITQKSLRDIHNNAITNNRMKAVNKNALYNSLCNSLYIDMSIKKCEFVHINNWPALKYNTKDQLYVKSIENNISMNGWQDIEVDTYIISTYIQKYIIGQEVTVQSTIESKLDKAYKEYTSNGVHDLLKHIVNTYLIDKATRSDENEYSLTIYTIKLSQDNKFFYIVYEECINNVYTDQVIHLFGLTSADSLKDSSDIYTSEKCKQQLKLSQKLIKNMVNTAIPKMFHIEQINDNYYYVTQWRTGYSVQDSIKKIILEYNAVNVKNKEFTDFLNNIRLYGWIVPYRGYDNKQLLEKFKPICNGDIPDIVITTSKKDIFILIYSTYSKAAYANGIFKCIIVNNDDQQYIQHYSQDIYTEIAFNIYN